MKKKFLNSSIKFLKQNGNYTEEELEIIIYGLEGIYLTFTKMVIIFASAYVLGLFKEVIFLLITYNIIRSQSFGIHASKSIYCLISSIVCFIGGALICKYVYLPFEIMLFLAIICNICLILYSPADTHKKPIVNLKKRKRFKYISVSCGIIYTSLIVGIISKIILIVPLINSFYRMGYNLIYGDIISTIIIFIMTKKTKHLYEAPQVEIIEVEVE